MKFKIKTKKGLTTNKRNMTLFIVFFLLISNQLSLSRTSDKVTIDQKMKISVISRISELVIEKYVFLEKSKEIADQLNLKLKNGEYDSFTTASEFAGKLERDLRDISSDSHFRVQYDPEWAKRILAAKALSKEEVEKAKKQEFEEWRQQNFGLFRVERLGGNIGYLDMRGFAPVDLDVETTIAAMNFLANSNAVIIDLRKNRGGDPRMVQFVSSYFIKEPTHLNSLVYRFKENPEVQYWTVPYISGKDLYDKDLYILTSDFTFSAGEDFAYTMKHLSRAVIIGEKTRGGAHEGDYVTVLEKFVMFLPMGNTVNPITKSNWEGTGVEPDIAVPQQYALDRAQLIILEKLIENETDELNKKIYTFALREIKGRLNPVEVDRAVLEKYAGIYGKRNRQKVVFENGVLFYKPGSSSYKLVPISEKLFYVDGADDFQIEFSVLEDGTINQLIIVWDDGFRSYLRKQDDSTA